MNEALLPILAALQPAKDQVGYGDVVATPPGGVSQFDFGRGPEPAVQVPEGTPGAVPDQGGGSSGSNIGPIIAKVLMAGLMGALATRTKPEIVTRTLALQERERQNKAKMELAKSQMAGLQAHREATLGEQKNWHQQYLELLKDREAGKTARSEARLEYLKSRPRGGGGRNWRQVMKGLSDEERTYTTNRKAFTAQLNILQKNYVYANSPQGKAAIAALQQRIKGETEKIADVNQRRKAFMQGYGPAGQGRSGSTTPAKKVGERKFLDDGSPYIQYYK